MVAWHSAPAATILATILFALMALDSNNALSIVLYFCPLMNLARFCCASSLVDEAGRGGHLGVNGLGFGTLAPQALMGGSVVRLEIHV